MIIKTMYVTIKFNKRLDVYEKFYMSMWLLFLVIPIYIRCDKVERSNSASTYLGNQT